MHTARFPENNKFFPNTGDSYAATLVPVVEMSNQRLTEVDVTRQKKTQHHFHLVESFLFALVDQSLLPLIFTSKPIPINDCSCSAGELALGPNNLTSSS